MLNHSFCVSLLGQVQKQSEFGRAVQLLMHHIKMVLMGDYLKLDLTTCINLNIVALFCIIKSLKFLPQMYLSIFLASRISHFKIIMQKNIFPMQLFSYLLSPCRFSLTHKLYSLIFITPMCICSDDNNFWNIYLFNKRYSHWVTKCLGTESLELSRMILLSAVTYRKKKYGASIITAGCQVNSH